MPIPRVAIVGRPNVGKSSLMNMIAGAKVSIVDPTPGVTRDRVTAIVDVPSPDNRASKTVEFMDTGGFGVYVAEGERFDEVGADLARLTESIEFQIAQAVEGADLILFAIDVQQGVTPQDEEIARLLRERRLGKGGKGGGKGEAGAKTKAPVVVIATKVDGPKWEMHALDLSSLGFGEAWMTSARTNYFRREFMDRVFGMLPEDSGVDDRPPADLMLAVIGKRNAGKSTLVNTLAGEPRMIVSEIAGTTRDAVDVRLEWDGKSVVVIDTAGLRRKRSFQNMVEHFAFDRVQRAIERADVIFMMLDATERISQVDEQLAALAQKSYKPVVIVVNKWDLAEGGADDRGRPATTERYEEYIRKELKGLWFAPIAFMTAATGRNVQKTMKLAMELREQAETRVTTGHLNRLVRRIMETRGPTDTVGTRAKVFYVAQTGVAPPTITMVVNKPELFRPNYLRFLLNRFREEFPFPEVPIRLVIRARRQREDDLARADGGEGPVRITRGMKGTDSRARQRAAEVESMTDEQLLKEFGDDLMSDDGSSEVDVGFDEALESGEFGETYKPEE
ncbi:MAG: ribosome biogenesis GTPase Der [Phycisphaerales bacterium]|nr:MAG: ribosome biogenesis GTPase Der [Phycisphaerales bacterium]